MPQFRTLATGLHPVSSYQVLLELGRGGMGSVHLARTMGVGGFERLVVVKRLLPHLIGDPEAVERFLAEARNAACVHHAHVVGIHQVGQDQEGYFLVLDYVEGASLDEVVQRSMLRRRRIPVPVLLRIVLDALEGLAAVHEARDPQGRALGMLHRDVSLENVLVGCDGGSRLADFGISKSAHASVQTGRNLLLGKLLYFAPEYLRRQPVGVAFDIYGLGMTMWLALCGKEPWPETSEAQLMQDIVDGVPAMDPQLEIPREVEALVLRACHLEPLQRFPSARAMARAIEELGKGTTLLATHGEVSDYIQTLMGIDLVRRRQRIAQRIEKMSKEATAADTSHTSLPRPAAHKEVTLGGSDSLVSLPVHWRPARVGWIAAAVLASGLALWWVSARSPAEPPAPASITQAPPRPAPPPSVPFPAAPVPPPPVAPVAPPPPTVVAAPVEAAPSSTIAPTKEHARDATRAQRTASGAARPVVREAAASDPSAAPAAAPAPAPPRARTRTSELEVPPDWQE